jgi:hypothetical protein
MTDFHDWKYELALGVKKGRSLARAHNGWLEASTLLAGENDVIHEVTEIRK